MSREPVVQSEAFVERWNRLDRRERLRMRRLVRMGRPMDDATEAELAVAYARFQMSRPWARMFWIWFVPGLVLALVAAGTIHPILIGVVLALAAQAVFARWNLRRVETVNASLLGREPRSRRRP